MTRLPTWARTCIGLGLLSLGCSSDSLNAATSHSAGSAGLAGASTQAGPGTGGAASGGATSVGGTTGGAEIEDLSLVLPSAARLVSLYEPPANFTATALAFDPLRAGELWVTLRRPLFDAPCTAEVTTGCAALRGQVALVRGATGEAPEMSVRRDGNAWHFMRRPTSIAFGTNGLLASCGEARTDNYEDEPIDYSGPTLWSSDPAIFGVTPEPHQNGTHLDMLHNTPYCMGIAHERDNIYFTFNGKIGALDRYDFKAPHEIGGEDHSDGEMYRYVEGELARVAEIPSHLALDAERRWLYVADTGHSRVVRLDIRTGSPAEDVETLDPMPVHARMRDATLEEFVRPGALEAPSGVLVVGSTLFVTDNATGRIHAFDREGQQHAMLQTELESGSLSGIAWGPDGKLYISDLLSGRAYRIEPR